MSSSIEVEGGRPVAGMRTLRIALVSASVFFVALLIWAATEWIEIDYPQAQLKHDHVRVQRLDVLSPIASRAEPRVTHDFDGDGVADTQEVDYLPARRLFGSQTFGVLRVCSGANGAVLLAHALAQPTTPVTWYGDGDGNGTDDLLVDGDGPFEVLAYTPPRR